MGGPNVWQQDLFDEYKFWFPNIQYTPEAIFTGKVPLLSVDFISGKYYDASSNKLEDVTGSWTEIRKVVSQWYKVIRMIAIIAFLSILIYTGIKIILSSNARDKAKYKEWILNWLMGVVLLFTMHYLMGFILSVTGEVTTLLGDACGEVKVLWIDGSDTNGNGKEEAGEYSYDDVVKTNLMGYARWRMNEKNQYYAVGYRVIYIFLIVITIKFTFVYLKRVLTMAFLTMIAPLVAFMYPIDKMNDGSAQAFNMWFKEYLFNALLQPMHLLLYTVLVGAAVTIATDNLIYAIVALLFLTEAEKLFKKIFGFDKAGGGTVGGFAGGMAAGATAAAIASNAKNIAGMIKGGGKGSSGGGNGASGTNGSNPALNSAKPTTSSDEEMQSFLENGNEQPVSQTENQDDNQKNEVLEKYKAEGYGQNANGEYFNPWTDEYDPNYDPLKDKTYNPTQDNESSKPDNSTNPNPPQDNNPTPGVNTNTIHSMAEEKNKKRSMKEKMGKGFKRGLKGTGAVVKKIAKPVWDADKSAGYNFTRLAKGAGKLAIGASAGLVTATVQAGISIADGKYNPLEGVASFAAGAAGGVGLASKIGHGVIDTYREGADRGDNEAVMNRALKTFRNNDEVIAFNQKNYAPEDQKRVMEREMNLIKNHGIKDLKEQKKCLKYTNSQMKDWENKHKGEADYEEKRKAEQDRLDKKSAATLNFQNRLKEEGQLGAIHDASKRKQYINTMVQQEAKTEEEKARVRTKYTNAFDSVIGLQAANR